AAHGHAVTALDRDGGLLAALRERAAGLPVETVETDARDFDLGRRFALCLVPMQTVQLLGGSAGRRHLWSCARAHLEPGGLLAAAISAELEPYPGEGESRLPSPAPPEAEAGGSPGAPGAIPP